MTRLTVGIIMVLSLLVMAEASRSSKKAAEGIQRVMFDEPAAMRAGGRRGMKLSDAPSQRVYYAHSSEDQGLPAIEPCQEVKCHMTLAVALDASASVRQANFHKEVAFTQQLLEIMALKAAENDVKICVGVLTYSTLVNVIVDPCCENSICRIIEELEDVPYDRRSTNTHGALKVARQMLQSAASYHKVLLLITDGKSTTGSPVPFAQQMRNEDGVEIVTLGVGYSIRESELRGISGSNEDVLLIDTFNDFHELATLIISANSIGSSLDITFEEFCREDFSIFSETCDRDEGCTWEEWSDCEPNGQGSQCTTMQPCVLPDGSYEKSRVKECVCPTETSPTTEQDLFDAGLRGYGDRWDHIHIRRPRIGQRKILRAKGRRRGYVQ